jgi:hypothetical protein
MNFLVELDDFRPEGAVYIYGSDITGQALRRALAERGILCCAFIDTFAAGEADGLTVLRFDQYLQLREPSDIILIASGAEAVISRNLEAHGIENYFGALQFET